MSRTGDARFLDALLGEDPDERTAAPGVEKTAGVPAPESRTVAEPRPAEDRSEVREPVAVAAAPARRPGSYEPVLPVPDDPEVVAQMRQRVGIPDEEPRLVGFLEGLLGIVAPEPERDARGRLIEAYGTGTAHAEAESAESATPGAAASDTAETDPQAPPIGEEIVPEVEEPVAAPAANAPESTPAVVEDPDEPASLPPLSHDGVADDAPPTEGHEDEPTDAVAAATDGADEPAEPSAPEPVVEERPSSATPTPAQDASSELVRSLTSFDVGRRRNALLTLLDRPLDRELATAAASSLRDPETGIRLLALQVLERAPELAPGDALEVAMLDPDAEIRRRAVSLVGRTGDLAFLPVLQERLEEETDEDVLAAGLAAVADLFRVAGDRAGTADLDRVSATVGHLRSTALPQLGRELQLLSRTLDAGEVRHRLGDVDEPIRIGAALLALGSDSEDSLRALARLVTDESARVRQLAMTAVSRLRSEDEGSGGPAPTVRPQDHGSGGSDERPMSRAVADEVQSALLPGLFEALTDPKQEIRDQARNALSLVDRDRLVDWVETVAPRADAEELVRVIGAARRLSLDETIPTLVSAAMTHTTGREAAQLAEALRELPAVSDLLVGWKASDAPEARADAVRLASLVGTDVTAAVLDGLQDPNANVRLVAIDAARGRIDDRLAEALLGLIERDPSTRVQVAALEAFRDAPARERTAAARVASESLIAEVRRAGLGLLAPEANEEFHLLAGALRDSDPSVVETAARLLSATGAPEATASLWSEIRGASGESRRLMLEILRAEQPEVLSRLAQRAVESMDAAERAAGLSALAMLGNGSVVEQVLVALGDPSVDVRLEALRALAVDAGSVGTAPLTAVMRDADARVRSQAVEVIAAAEDENTLPLLLDALDDPAETVRLATRRALGTLRSPAAVDLLLEALERPAHRAAAVEALAALGEMATGRLVRALVSTSGDVRESVREALLRSGVIERTLRNLGAPRPARRLAALTLLRAVRPEGVAPAVAERLEDPDPEVRQEAARLLGELGDATVVPALQQAFVNDPDMDVVAAVETAYRRLGGGQGPS